LDENRISYEQIENVTVDLNLYDSYLMKFPDPKNGEEAKFSYPHIMGAAVLKGKIWVDSFTDESVRDPLLQEAKRKVSVVIHKEWPPGRVDARTPVTVMLKGGGSFSREISAPSEPTLEQLLERYREAAQGIWTIERTQRSIDLLLNLEKQSNLSPLMDLLTIRE
jgi:2-methylcitrate dehydratase PrpD